MRMFGKLRAKSELNIALSFLLHDAPSLIPSIKKLNGQQWSGFARDVANGTPAYEEAAAVLSIFFRRIYNQMDQSLRARLNQAILEANYDRPPAFLSVIAQVTYYLYLAELEEKVRPKLWASWVNDMANLMACEQVDDQQAGLYIIAYSNRIRDEKRREHQPESERNPRESDPRPVYFRRD